MLFRSVACCLVGILQFNSAVYAVVLLGGLFAFDGFVLLV